MLSRLDPGLEGKWRPGPDGPWVGALWGPFQLEALTIAFGASPWTGRILRPLSRVPMGGVADQILVGQEEKAGQDDRQKGPLDPDRQRPSVDHRLGGDTKGQMGEIEPIRGIRKITDRFVFTGEQRAKHAHAAECHEPSVKGLECDRRQVEVFFGKDRYQNYFACPEGPPPCAQDPSLYQYSSEVN